jgi:hypothetical protein
MSQRATRTRSAGYTTSHIWPKSVRWQRRQEAHGARTPSASSRPPPASLAARRDHRSRSPDPCHLCRGAGGLSRNDSYRGLGRLHRSAPGRGEATEHPTRRPQEPPGAVIPLPCLGITKRPILIPNETGMTPGMTLRYHPPAPPGGRRDLLPDGHFPRSRKTQSPCLGLRVTPRLRTCRWRCPPVSPGGIA